MKTARNGGHDFSRAATGVRRKRALAPEGFEAGPSEAKASCRLRFFGTTEVVPSRSRKAYFHRRHGEREDSRSNRSFRFFREPPRLRGETGTGRAVLGIHLTFAAAWRGRLQRRSFARELHSTGESAP